MIGSRDSGPVGIFILHTTSHKFTFTKQLLLLFVVTMQSPASSSEQDSTNTTPVKVAATEIVNVSAKSRKRIVLAEGSPINIGGSKRERKIAGQKELQFDTLIPFKNHPTDWSAFHTMLSTTQASQPLGTLLRR